MRGRKRRLVLFAAAVAVLTAGVGTATAGWEGLSDIGYYKYDDPGHVCTNGIEFGVAYPFGQAANLKLHGDRGHLDANGLFVPEAEIIPETTIGPLTQYDPSLVIAGNTGQYYDLFRFAWTAPVAVGSRIELHIFQPSSVFPEDTIENCTLSFWQFTGFSQPVDNEPTVNRMNAGRAAPVKFSLGGDRGLDIFAAGYPQVRSVPCGSSTDVVEETTSSDSSHLSYSSADDRYTYLWKTDRAWAGQCKQLVLKFADHWNSDQSATFSFR
jgi:hypothetical protein